MIVKDLFQGKQKNAKKPKGTPYKAYSTPKELKRRLRTRVPTSRDKREIKPSDATGIQKAKEPDGDEDSVVFVTYSPLDIPSDTSLVDHSPPDRSGDDSEQRIVIHASNTYVAYSTDNGLTFKTIDPTTVFPKSLGGGLAGDQVILYVPKVARFIWFMQHKKDPKTRDGTFRLAYASPDNVRRNFYSAWSYYDFKASEFGLKGVDLDYPDLAASDKYLFVTTNAKNKGRIVIRLLLKDLIAGSVGSEYTPPLEVGKDPSTGGNTLDYAHLCQQSPDGAFWAGHVDNSTLRVYSMSDSSSSYSSHDVKVGSWPNSSDYSSTAPDGGDWLGCDTCGDAEISGAVRRGDELWFAWTASHGAGMSGGFDFPNPHVRMATIRISDWTLINEMQIWNNDYAFAYPTLNTNSMDEVGVGVAFGGEHDFADAAFGIIGDFVVWYMNASDTTVKRWGDFITTRRCKRRPDWFAGFGYYTLKDASVTKWKVYQKPYYVLFSRKSRTP